MENVEYVTWHVTRGATRNATRVALGYAVWDATWDPSGDDILYATEQDIWDATGYALNRSLGTLGENL